MIYQDVERGERGIKMYQEVSKISKQAGSELCQSQAPVGWPVEAEPIKKQMLQSK